MLVFKRVLVLCAAVVLFFACRKSSSANWDVDVLLPVVTSSLNIKNFASDTLFKVDNTGLLYLSLNREIASLKLDSLLNLPDTMVVDSFENTSPFPLPLKPGDPVPFFPPTDFKFTIDNGVELKRVDIRKGTISVKFSNDVAQTLDLKYSLPSVTKNGSPFIISESIPFGKYSLVKTYDLAGYSMDLRGLSGHGFNTIAQEYTLALNPNSSSVSVNYNEGAKVEVTYSEIVPAYVEGYFGKQKIDIPLDTARFGLIENFSTSNFLLSDAMMDFTLINEFGAEFSGAITNIKSFNTTENKVVPLTGGQLANINIDRASKVASTVYPSIKSFSFNSVNSNVSPFISIIPDKLTYMGSVLVNPLGNIHGHTDFAFYNTGIRIVANVRIPLKFSADYFELRSNSSVDFSGVEQLDNVNSGHFVVSASNGYPFAARLQGYMYDEQNNLIDSLFIHGANTIAAGRLNAQNEVIEPTKSSIKIPVTKGKIEHLKNCRTIKVLSRFIMPPNPPDIKILETYQIDLKIIAELNYNVGVDSN